MALWGKKRVKSQSAPDPLQVALDATLADLRRLASDMSTTSAAMNERLMRMKEPTQ